jgi:nicotinamidase-related amidase
MRRINPAALAAYGERVEKLVVPNVQRLQQAFRAAGAELAYTELGCHRPDRRDLAGWARRHNALGQQMLGTPLYATFDEASCRVDARVAPRAGEIVVQKTTSGPTGSTKLDHMLRVRGVETVIVAGILTDVCVAQAARELGDRDFDAIVVEDACATYDPTLHKAALDTIAMTFGRVLSTQQVLERIG